MNRMELDRDKQIDPNQLDVEAARQAEVFFKWAEKSVEAKAIADKLEFDLDVLEAKLQMRAREDPEKFNIRNATETAIKSAVKIHPQYTAAVEAYFAARKESELLFKVVVTMEQRKRMIEVLITLHGQEYFAGPSVPRDLVTAWREYREGLEDELGEKQRSKARRRVREVE